MSWLPYAVALWLGVHYAYVVVMAAKAALAKGTLTKYWLVMLTPVALIGLVLDLVFNWTFGLMFLAKPRPYLFSSTVQYWYRHGEGWRWKMANFWRRNLNVFDAEHIRP